MLKITVNTHIRTLVNAYREKITILEDLLRTERIRCYHLQHDLDEAKNQVKFLKEKTNKILQADVVFSHASDPYEFIEMRFRINKYALKTARFHEHLFEQGWEDIKRSMLKHRHD